MGGVRKTMTKQRHTAFTTILRWSVSFLRVLAGLFFVANGLIGFRHPWEFLAYVYDFQLAGPTLGAIIASTLPVLQIAVGVALISGLLVEGALFIAAGISATAITIHISILARGMGITPAWVNPWHIAEARHDFLAFFHVIVVCLAIVHFVDLRYLRIIGTSRQET